MMYTAHAASGSILNEHFVLTNAGPLSHGWSRFEINANSPRTWDATPGDVYLVDEVYVHPDYDIETNKNDIGLVHTELPIVFHARVQPIALSDVWLSPSDDVVFAGYGFNEEAGIIHAPLAVVESRSITNEACRANLETEKSTLIDDDKVCVIPQDNRVIYRNDNGAALTLNEKLVGVNSWSIDGTAGAPIVTERVASHMDFIRKFVH